MLNKVQLIGNLGKHPEMRYANNGTASCSFSVATTERWKDKNSNQMQESTEWHNIVVWGAQAENCSKYLEKGKRVYVEGKVQTRSWEDKDGQKRYTTEIVAKDVKFLSPASQQNQGAPQQNQGAPQNNYQQRQPAQQGEQQTQTYQGNQRPNTAPANQAPLPNTDDIPF